MFNQTLSNRGELSWIPWRDSQTGTLANLPHASGNVYFFAFENSIQKYVLFWLFRAYTDYSIPSCLFDVAGVQFYFIRAVGENKYGFLRLFGGLRTYVFQTPATYEYLPRSMFHVCFSFKTRFAGVCRLSNSLRVHISYFY